MYPIEYIICEIYGRVIYIRAKNILKINMSENMKYSYKIFALFSILVYMGIL